MKKKQAFLVCLRMPKEPAYVLDEIEEEMRELARAARIQIGGFLRSQVREIDAGHYLKSGKLQEIHQEAITAECGTILFNINLSAVQARNIEKNLKLNTMDRTGLILEIFGRRAQSKEGKLQVELARLNYILPRLMGLGGVMSRLGGGVGTRGPGESELEHDRRKIRLRITRVKEELKAVERHRKLIRSSRRREHLLTAALVGYTNAGKSTLLNALTGSDAFVEDQLFATLDPKTRMQSYPHRGDILFVDTVGFIKDLPHQLIEAFHATLEEVGEADILLHVLDASNPAYLNNLKAVEAVLKELGALEKPRLLILNKADKLNPAQMRSIQESLPTGIFTSALDKTGLRSIISQLP